MDIIINRRNDFTAVIAGLDVNVLAGYAGRLVLATEAGGEVILTKNGTIADPAKPEVDFVILPADLAGKTPGSCLCEVDIWKTADTTCIYRVVSQRVALKTAAGPSPS